MTYLAVSQMAHDEALQGRIAAAAAMERLTWPDGWVARRRWQLVARSDWADAWAYATSTGKTNPGPDPGVITDQMILSAIQAEAMEGGMQ